jgi:hypothetical protein
MFLLFYYPSATLNSTTATQTRYYRTPRELPPLTPEQRGVIVGCLLGDLNIQKRYTNAVLRFVQGVCNIEYLMHLYSIFEAFCGTNSPPSGVDPPHPRFLDLTCSVQKRK